jgi:GH24 family phage-related lysozyme (muramidase)
VRVAIETGNRARLDTELDEGIKNGYLFPFEREEANVRFTEHAEQQKKAAAVAQFDSARNAIVTLAAGRGEAEALKELDAGTFGSLDPAAQESLRNIAKQVAGQRSAEAMDQLANGIYAGALNSEAEIDELANSPHVTPQVTAKAKDDLRRRDLQAESEDRRNNGVKNSVELFTRIRDLQRTGDIKKDAETYYSTLAEIKRRVNEDSDGTLTKLLSEKMWGTAPKLKPDEIILENLHKQLAGAFDPVTGSLPWKIETPVYELDKSGKPKMRGGKPMPVKDEHGRVRTEMKIDAAARARAIDAQTVVMQKLRDYFDTHPGESHNLEKAKQKLNEFLPEGTRAGVLDALQKRRALQTNPQAMRGPVDEDLLATVKGFEGFTPTPQHDFRQTSIGYGTRAKPGETAISETDAEARLREELSMHAARVDETARKLGLALSRGQRNALISFDYNTGQGAYLLESSGGNLNEMKRRLKLYTKAGGQELPGLVNRRKTEAQLFDS